MILEIKESSVHKAAELANAAQAFHITYLGKSYLITGSNVKEVPAILEVHTQNHWVFANDIQLASRKFQGKNAKLNLEMSLSAAKPTIPSLLVGLVL